MEYFSQLFFPRRAQSPPEEGQSAYDSLTEQNQLLVACISYLVDKKYQEQKCMIDQLFSRIERLRRGDKPIFVKRISHNNDKWILVTCLDDEFNNHINQPSDDYMVMEPKEDIVIALSRYNPDSVIVELK